MFLKVVCLEINTERNLTNPREFIKNGRPIIKGLTKVTG